MIVGAFHDRDGSHIIDLSGLNWVNLIQIFVLVVATILDLGNQIWANMVFEEPIQDATVFFR